jgi:hypothetical protein
MRMIGDHHYRVENVTLPIVVPAMLKNKIPRAHSKRIADQLSKRHKDCPVSLLIMRQSPSVLIFVNQRRGSGHEFIE